MNRTWLFRVAVLVVVCGVSWAAPADSEVEQLRAQNTLLKAQLEALQQSCRADAAATPVLKNSSQASSATAVIVPPPPQAPQAAAVGSATPGAAAPPAASAVASSASPAPPPGYRLVKIDPITDAEDAENCRHGVFGMTADAPWKHAEKWSNLSQEMSPAQVESQLGKIHTIRSKRGRIVWEYGKCGLDSPAQAYVVFDGSGLLFWQQPDF